jgi:hypothetical protein
VVDELEVDGKFKKAVIKELKALGETVDLKPLVRDYMEGLGAVHDAFRGMVKDRMDIGAVDLEKARADFLAGCKEDHPGLALTLSERHPNGTFTVISHYPNEALEYLDVLKARTRNFANYSRRIVTTRPLQK